MKIELNPYQFDYVYSQKRYPAFVGGWGVGKTLCAIMRAQTYSKTIPNNLGVIFRKTARSLADSTLKDFEKYTGLKVDSNRNYTYPNGSTIMFRHMDEIDSINQQNINLGWFYIEQGEELDSDKEFFMLFGRLRRDLEPTDTFKQLGMPERSGWVVANAGDHWMKPLWKEGKLDNAELIEATTKDNAHNLPDDFLESLETLRTQKPEIYQQYVENDWSVDADQFVLIKTKSIEDLRGKHFHIPLDKYIVSCDPSMGGDECVFYAFKNTEIIDTKILHIRDTMKVTGELILFMQKHDIMDLSIDTIGIGRGIGDRMAELGKRVQFINSSQSAGNKDKFYNLRAEMWWHCMQQILNGEVSFPLDDELRRQLSNVRYQVVNSNGRVKIEHKDETKKRMSGSPDRADAFIYGIWGLRSVETVKRKDAYARRIPEYTFNPATV